MTDNINLNEEYAPYILNNQEWAIAEKEGKTKETFSDGSPKFIKAQGIPDNAIMFDDLDSDNQYSRKSLKIVRIIEFTGDYKIFIEQFHKTTVLIEDPIVDSAHLILTYSNNFGEIEKGIVNVGDAIGLLEDGSYQFIDKIILEAIRTAFQNDNIFKEIKLSEIATTPNEALDDANDIHSIMNDVSNVLKNAEGLHVEVLAWAFQELKSNPNLTVGQAIGYGFAEWVK